MTTPVIETRDLTKDYGGTVGLEGLDLTVEAGEVLGFLGPNGAGKTTAIRLLLDLIRPTRGEARLFGTPAADTSVRARVGYLPGELMLDPRLTGRDTLDFLAALQTVASPRRDEVCARLGLSGKDLERRTREYSRGIKQKLGLAAALTIRGDRVRLRRPAGGRGPQEGQGLGADSRGFQVRSPRG